MAAADRILRPCSVQACPVHCADVFTGLHALWESVFMKMEQEPDQLRHRGRPKEDKYCGVCGDKALGYNFDAISCESCKAFFRRNAPKGLVRFVLIIGNCQIIWTLGVLLNNNVMKSSSV